MSGSILAGSIGAHGGSPTDAAFTTAFAVSGAVALVAAVTALFIPIGRGRPGEHLTSAEELGAAAPLGEPAYGVER